MFLTICERVPYLYYTAALTKFKKKKKLGVHIMFEEESKKLLQKTNYTRDYTKSKIRSVRSVHFDV